MPGGGRPSSDDAHCKLCRKGFGKDVNPLVKNPSRQDLLERRTPGSKECKACFSFLRSDTHFGNMTRAKLIETLQDPVEQQKYDEEFACWCDSRREGKRRRGGLASNGFSLGHQRLQGIRR